MRPKGSKNKFPAKIIPLEERFSQKIIKGLEPDECWIWIGRISNTGYGNISKGRGYEGVVSAHRLSFTIHKGNIPAGLIVMHSCDNRRCVNPLHLFLGTHKTNAEDCISKGRFKAPSKGSKHPRSILTEEQAKKAKDLSGQYGAQKALAKEYGVHQTTISAIMRNKNWKHIGEEGVQ